MGWHSVSSTSLGSALGGMSCRCGTKRRADQEEGRVPCSDRVHARLQETAGMPCIEEASQNERSDCSEHTVCMDRVQVQGGGAQKGGA